MKLTENQLNKFRQHPGTFDDMVQAIFDAGVGFGATKEVELIAVDIKDGECGCLKCYYHGNGCISKIYMNCTPEYRKDMRHIYWELKE